jgi:hypothetical protein
MQYCYHCSEPITKPTKVCPHCKRSLDMSMFESLLSEQEDSEIHKISLRRIWFQEHAHIIWPVITLFIGFIVGGLILYGISRLQFAETRAELEEEIASLESKIEQKDDATSDIRENLNSQLSAKDNIITILDEQKELLTRIINFTRRFAQNSLITPNSESDANSYKRNFIYLNNQFYDKQEELEQTDHSNIKNYNLQPIPQILSD